MSTRRRLIHYYLPWPWYWRWVHPLRLYARDAEQRQFTEYLDARIQTLERIVLLGDRVVRDEDPKP